MSLTGSQMGYAAISDQVGHHTKAAFGRPISPHMFRDCVATGIAISAPGQVPLILWLLGHSALATSEEHYNLAGTPEAGRRHGKVITDLRGMKARE